MGASWCFILFFIKHVKVVSFVASHGVQAMVSCANPSPIALPVLLGRASNAYVPPQERRRVLVLNLYKAMLRAHCVALELLDLPCLAEQRLLSKPRALHRPQRHCLLPPIWARSDRGALMGHRRYDGCENGRQVSAGRSCTPTQGNWPHRTDSNVGRFGTRTPGQDPPHPRATGHADKRTGTIECLMFPQFAPWFFGRPRKRV